MSESRDLLQHPRRNLGNRYRSTAQKFAKLATSDPQRAKENLAWAEQNARQAILHDFTDERNWRCLAEIKVFNSDGEGLHALLEDVFIVLGRDHEQLEQLQNIDYLLVGRELLEAAFTKDPLIRTLGGQPWREIHPSNRYLNLRSDAVAWIFEINEPTSSLDAGWNAFGLRGMKNCSLNLHVISSLIAQ